MNKSTRSSLIKAMSKCSLRELPEEHNGNDVWIKALALVVKSTGEESFVSLTKDPKTLTDNITCDFGGTGAITKVKSVYPYLYLSSDFIPSFSDKTKESRIKYLKAMDESVDWSKKSLRELNEAIIGVAIKRQLNNIKSNVNYIEEMYGEGYSKTEARGEEDSAEVDM